VNDDDSLHLRPIGTVRSPLRELAAAPRQGDEGALHAELVLDPDVRPGLDGLQVGDALLVLTWLHLARRDVLHTRPRDDPARREQGVFSTRSPDRPNPIGLHRVQVLAIRPDAVEVDGLEAVDGTPVLDLKPVLGSVQER
jgi:tRNA-Thr(GGU) m(6)t(6)A37 methyltransferase TsaA